MSGTDPSPQELREEIEQTREELGDTVEALAAKTDVKAQAKRKVRNTKASVTDKRDELVDKVKDASPDDAVGAASQLSSATRENPMPLVSAGAFFVGFLIGRMTKH
jgi:ElaB/YqjD/DUF883 family membrane-anchored ribosome-binding protein